MDLREAYLNIFLVFGCCIGLWTSIGVRFIYLLFLFYQLYMHDFYDTYVVTYSIDCISRVHGVIRTSLHLYFFIPSSYNGMSFNLKHSIVGQ